MRKARCRISHMLTRELGVTRSSGSRSRSFRERMLKMTTADTRLSSSSVKAKGSNSPIDELGFRDTSAGLRIYNWDAVRRQGNPELTVCHSKRRSSKRRAWSLFLPPVCSSHRIRGFLQISTNPTRPQASEEISPSHKFCASSGEIVDGSMPGIQFRK